MRRNHMKIALEHGLGLKLMAERGPKFFEIVSREMCSYSISLLLPSLGKVKRREPGNVVDPA